MLNLLVTKTETGKHIAGKKVNAGTTAVYYGETFFCDDSQVKKCLEETYKCKTGKTTGQDSCGQVHWQAAKSQAKSLQKLDETGVMVAGCRHALMQKAVNMWTGEMYGYGLYLQKNVLKPIGVKYLFYDVICKYWPWMKNICTVSNQFAKESTLIPALGQLHGKLHKWTCRVLYGRQWQAGAGHTTGEKMETAFQYLSRCGSTTKNMTRAGRMEHLTEHVLFWNQKKIISLPKYLSLRYVKVLGELKFWQDEHSKTGVSESVLWQWKGEIISATKDEEASTARVSDDERAEYFRLSQEIREAEALQGFSSVSSQSLSVLVGNETFFQPSHNVNARLGNKEGSPCCTEEQTYAAGCGRRNVGGCWPTVPGRLCSQYPQRENYVRDVFDKKTSRNDQQGDRFSNQFTFFSKKLAFHSFSKIQVYFVMFLSPSGNVSVCV